MVTSVETFSEDTMNDLGVAVSNFLNSDKGRELVTVSHAAFVLTPTEMNKKAILNIKDFFLPVRFTAILIYKQH